MPPKKNITGESAKKLVKEYMLQQNRPYNSSILYLNLHKAVGKTELEKVLKELSNEEVLCCKEYKKFKFFWANQEKIGDVSEERINQLKEDLKKLEEESKLLTRTCDRKEKEANSLSSTPTNTCLAETLDEAQAEKKNLTKKLQEAKNSSGSTSKADIEEMHNTLEKQVGVWRKRKSIAMDIINYVSEGSGQSLVGITEEAGVERDEDCNNMSLQVVTEFLHPPPAKRARF